MFGRDEIVSLVGWYWKDLADLDRNDSRISECCECDSVKSLLIHEQTNCEREVPWMEFLFAFLRIRVCLLEWLEWNGTSHLFAPGLSRWCLVNLLDCEDAIFLSSLCGRLILEWGCFDKRKEPRTHRVRRHRILVSILTRILEVFCNSRR